MPKKSFSFIIPSFNEEKNLTGTIIEINKVIARQSINDYELIIVNDCSFDNTEYVANQLKKKYKNIRVVNNRSNLGFGGSYKIGVKNATKDYVIMVPGDNAHPAEGIYPILRLAGYADIIIPYITNNLEARSLFRRIISRTYTGMVNTLFSLDVPYYNGCVLHKRHLIQSITINTDSFAYQAEGLLRLLKKGHSFIVIGVDFNERDQGKSSAFNIGNIYKVIKTIIMIKVEFISMRTKNN